ncbi:unnamed protein product [Rotaria sordida]|uniref:Uncharacterized protein n=1 Tax=Rotaria sordida TaxID=392033 RepID=A0A815H3T3_9BILA|nr:unnamed protein product [Rotaria sordida]CAF1348846.1 unnamed protein product [Rotaria sordida]
MSNNNGTYVKESDFPTNTDYSHVHEKIVDGTNNTVNKQQILTNYGDTLPAISNQNSSSNLVVACNTYDENQYYDEGESLFNKQLILLKNLKSPFDIQYKTDYFPCGGKNANKPQPPHYLHSVDDDKNIIIKFPHDFKPPKKCDNYYLEVALLTVPRIGQHYIHVNKFQLDNTDNTVMDQNPFCIRLTEEHFKKGEISVKLVLVKTRRNDLRNISSLQLFNEQDSLNWTADCKTISDLEHDYELSHAMVAFSLGFINKNNKFIRFTKTTIISNEIVEKEKSKSSDSITCPHCSLSFNIKEQKSKNQKRSISSSNSIDKKCPSKRQKKNSN